MCSTLIAIGDRVEVKGLGYPNQPKYNRCRGDVIKIEEGCLRIRLLPNYFAGAELLVPPGYLNLVKSEPSPSTASSGTLTTSRPAGWVTGKHVPLHVCQIDKRAADTLAA